MATITAQQVQDAQKQQVQGVIDALRVVHAQVEAMRDSTLGDFQLWLGGLPQQVQQAGGQSYYYAQQLGEVFGIDVPPIAPEA